jgi:hypothetical protein
MFFCFEFLKKIPFAIVMQILCIVKSTSFEGTSNNDNFFVELIAGASRPRFWLIICREYAVFGAAGARIGRAGHTTPLWAAIRSSATIRRML